MFLPNAAKPTKQVNSKSRLRAAFFLITKIVAMLDFFGGGPARDLGITLADIVAKGLEHVEKKESKKNSKSKKRIISNEIVIDHKIRDFINKRKLNIYSKARLGSAFKFSLIDKGIDKSVAEDLTAWILLKLR